MTDRPRVLFVGSSRYDLPLTPGLERKWSAVGEEVDFRVIARAGRLDGGDDRFTLVRPVPAAAGGLGFYARLPQLVYDEGRRFRPDVVVAQSAYEAFAALGGLRALHPRPRLVVELHGDAATASRHYGSRLRRAYAPLADRAARFALRRADATRAVSNATAQLARAATGSYPEASFPAYVDLTTFSGALVPPPDVPRAVWIGALQRVKDPAAVVEAWRTVARELPSARLSIVGDGPLRDEVRDLAAGVGPSIELCGHLPAESIAGLLDRSSLLCMTSLSEGQGRVILEAFARARPVVGFDVGGIGETVVDGRTGRLVPRRDVDGLAGALVGLLENRAQVMRMGDEGRRDLDRRGWTPQRYAAAVGDLVRRVAAEPVTSRSTTTRWRWPRRPPASRSA